MPLNILVLIIHVVQPFIYNNYAFSRIVTVEDEVVRKEHLLQSKDSEIHKLTEKVIPLSAPLLHAIILCRINEMLYIYISPGMQL